MTLATFPPDVEMRETLAELAREERALAISERAQADRRVTDKQDWQDTMARRRQRINDLKAERDRLQTLTGEANTDA